MKRGLLRLSAFFIAFGAIALALQQGLNAGLRRIHTSEFGASNKIMSGQVNAQIVISGSSRALVHYDPRIIESVTGRSAYNLGRNSAQTDMQLAFLKAYLKHNIKPKVVVHNLDLYTFVMTREVDDPGQYMPYLYEDEIYGELCRINPQTWKWKYVPLYGYAVEDMRFTWVKALGGLAGLSGREDFFLGYNPRNMVWTGDFDRYKASNPTGVKVEIERQAAGRLEELVGMCRNQGIQIIFVYSPEYEEMQGLTLNREEVFGVFRELSARLKVPFWDYSQSDMCRSRDLFYNSQHLNHKGAELFTTDLAKRLLSAQFGEVTTPVALAQASN